MNPNEAAGEGLDGRVTAEQGEEAAGEGQADRRPQKGAWGPVVAEEHYWDPSKAADAARILAAHPPRDYTVATTIGQPDDCPNCNHPYLLNGCTCRPWTRQTDPPRYLDQPGDTVDMIGGYEVGADCPHHQPTEADAEPAGGTYTPSWSAGDTPLATTHRRTFRFDAAAEPQPRPSDSEQYARDIECAIGLNSGGTGPDMVHAVRDAVLRVRDQQLTHWRRKAIRRGLAVSRLQGVIQALEELAAEEITHRGEWGNGYRDAQRDLLELLTTLQPGH